MLLYLPDIPPYSDFLDHVVRLESLLVSRCQLCEELVEGGNDLSVDVDYLTEVVSDLVPP